MCGIPFSFLKRCEQCCAFYFENKLPLTTTRPKDKWKHEDGSEMMFDDLIKLSHVDITLEEATIVKALIAGEPSRCV